MASPHQSDTGCPLWRKTWFIIGGLILGIIVIVWEWEAIRHFYYAIGHRITATNLPQILSTITWPIVVLAGIIVFRDAIYAAIDRIIEVSIGKNTLKLSSISAAGEESGGGGQNRIPQPEAPAPVGGAQPAQGAGGAQPAQGAGGAQPAQAAAGAHPAQSVINTKPGDVFWVACDLMVLFDLFVRGGDRSTLLKQFTFLDYHMRMLEFQDSAFYKRFRRLDEAARSSLLSDWTPQKRGEFATELLAIRSEIAHVIESRQPNFDQGHP